MKKTKLLLVFLMVIVMTMNVLVGYGDSNTKGTTNLSGLYTPGTYSASSKGFGGELTVTITVDSNTIKTLKIVGNRETPTIGGLAIKSMSTEILKKGEKVNAVAGATRTSTAIKTALSAALAQASGAKTAAALTMKDGTYQASAFGFSLLMPVQVSVSVKNNRISAIFIGKNDETNGKPRSVQDIMIPSIIENQSLAVDVVTGATATSNAVLQAAHDCLIKAGAKETALYKELPKSTTEEAYTVDVVVVGFGGSGAAAALSAAENGASVMVLEKAGRIGGTSAVTSGPMAVNPPSKVKSEIVGWADPATGKTITKKAGENLVDADMLFKEWSDYTKVNGVQDARVDIIQTIISVCGETIDWLTGYGFKFDNPKGFLGNKWALFTPYTGNKDLTESYFQNMLDKFTYKLGGKYLLHTEATELIVVDGKIAGVRAIKQDGTKVTVNAKSIILATGGFGGNDEMMKKYLGESWKLYGTAQNDGAGIRMATSIGAVTKNIDMPPMSHFSAPPVILKQFGAAFDNDIPFGMVNTSEALAVDKKGNRFVNEMNIGTEAYVGGSRFYSIYSKEQIDILREKGFAFASTGRYLNRGGIKTDTPMKNIDAVMDAGVKAGFIYKADNLEKLAELISKDNGNMTSKALLSTVTNYNEGIKAGIDAMGKKADRFQRLGAINTESNYYIAVTGAPYIYSTCGGLDVNNNMQVMDAKGKAIEGLYAVGTDSMGVLFTNKKGYANFGGVAQGYCFSSGKIAGIMAARNLK
jgi:fumarate reductase flavoprotein subunit